MNILFDETQKERGSINQNFERLAELLEEEGHKIRRYTSYPIKYTSINNSDIFVFLCPDGSKLYGHEVKALLRYVDEGGCLVIFDNAGGDKGLNTNMNTLLKHFDIELVANQIFDYQNFDLELESNVIVTKLYKHAFTEGIEKLTIVSSCSVNPGKNVKEIARTQSSSDPPSATVMATSSYGLGSVFVCGSYLMFSDRKAGIDLSDNRKIIKNIFEHIAESPLSEATAQEEEIEAEEITEEVPVIEEPSEVPLSKVDMVKEVLQKGGTDSVKQEVIKAMDLLKEEVRGTKTEIKEPPKMQKEDIYEAIAIIEELEKEIDSLNIEDPGYRDILITDMARRQGIDYTQILPYLEKMRARKKGKKPAEKKGRPGEVDLDAVPTPPMPEPDAFEREVKFFEEPRESIREIQKLSGVESQIGDTNFSELVTTLKEFKNSVDVLSANLIHLLSEILIEMKEQRKRKK
ncbi:MAG: hypothetical protein H7645_08920 [Candidatus Heimdallarchaeota archaeon]|nr:hypothetical protein [Candidatus Heimdallarchaeota archaeon]MCK4770447.1 hypothetical protein [Candidatus Heimdallarchaeota archaeon]